MCSRGQGPQKDWPWDHPLRMIKSTMVGYRDYPSATTWAGPILWSVGVLERHQFSQVLMPPWPTFGLGFALLRANSVFPPQPLEQRTCGLAVGAMVGCIAGIALSTIRRSADARTGTPHGHWSASENCSPTCRFFL